MNTTEQPITDQLFRSAATIFWETFMTGVSRTQTEKHIGLDDPAQREQLNPAAVKVFVDIADARLLTDAQALGLIGAITPSTLPERLAENDGRTLDLDTLMRISFLIKIYTGLKIYFSHDLAKRWIKLANQNPLFVGKAPVNYMLQNGQDGLRMVV